METSIKTKVKLAALAGILPACYGCQGGGELSLGSLVGSSGVALLSSGDGGGGTQLATIGHNPEPATMLLVGGGIAAMAIASLRKNKSAS